MVTAVAAKIVSIQPNLTVSENEIARFVLQNADVVVSSTITKMAELTSTSEASINRFCKKIGFKGFNSFKIALAQESFYNNMWGGRERDTDVGYLDKIGRSYRTLLANTAAMLNEDSLMSAVAMLETAPAIHIFGFANTGIVAREFEFKLQMTGLNARAITDTNIMRMFSATVEKSDVVFAIVPSILLRDIYISLGACKERGAKVLALTSFDSSKLDDLVDLKFITSDRITTQNSLALSNNFVYLYVLDVLYAALLDRNPEMLRKKRDSDAFLDMHQTSDNYFYQY